MLLQRYSYKHLEIGLISGASRIRCVLTRNMVSVKITVLCLSSACPNSKYIKQKEKAILRFYRLSNGL